MRSDRRLAVMVCVLCILLTPQLAAGTIQIDSEESRSTGFSDPSQYSTLLDYQLPDWGNHRWWFEGDFQAGGSEDATVDRQTIDTTLSTRFTLFRQSERRRWDLSAGILLDGIYSQTDRRNDESDSVRRIGAVNADLRAFRRNYVLDPLAWILGGQVMGSYWESNQDHGSEGRTTLSRQFRATAEAGFGLGRKRDVLPVLRALRFSERLMALGRPGLSSDQARQVAEVFSRRIGHAAVYDRYERHFWDDLFHRFDGGQDFSAFEVLYLVEALVEDLGVRQQGWVVDVTGQVQRFSDDYSSGSNDRTSAGPRVSASWSHNLSLTQQIGLSASGSHLAVVDEPSGQQNTFVVLQGSHLVLVADRAQWSQSARADFARSRQSSSDWSESRTLQFASRFSYFVEDRVSMGPSLTLSWRDRSGGGATPESWVWTLGFDVTYEIGRGLF